MARQRIDSTDGEHVKQAETFSGIRINLADSNWCSITTLQCVEWWIVFFSPIGSPSLWPPHWHGWGSFCSTLRSAGSSPSLLGPLWSHRKQRWGKYTFPHRAQTKAINHECTQTSWTDSNRLFECFACVLKLDVQIVHIYPALWYRWCIWFKTSA